MIIYGFVTFQPMTLSQNAPYPIWPDILGNVANGLVAMSMILFAIYTIVKSYMKKESLHKLIEPGPTWVPLRLNDRVFANLILFEDRYKKLEKTEDDDDMFGEILGRDDLEIKMKNKDRAKVFSFKILG